MSRGDGSAFLDDGLPTYVDQNLFCSRGHHFSSAEFGNAQSTLLMIRSAHCRAESPSNTTQNCGPSTFRWGRVLWSTPWANVGKGFRVGQLSGGHEKVKRREASLSSIELQRMAVTVELQNLGDAPLSREITATSSTHSVICQVSGVSPLLDAETPTTGTCESKDQTDLSDCTASISARESSSPRRLAS